MSSQACCRAFPNWWRPFLGTWRIGAVYQPLFTAFGPKAIEHRLETSGAKLVVTNTANRGKLDEVEDCPRVATILAPEETLQAGDIDFRAAVAAASPDCPPIMRKGDDLFMMMSTSGTTGLPKGVPVPLNALLAFGAYMRDAIGLRPDDVFWNIADPGWAYGLYYAITVRCCSASPRPSTKVPSPPKHLRRHRAARRHQPCRFADRLSAC